MSISKSRLYPNEYLFSRSGLAITIKNGKRNKYRTSLNSILNKQKKKNRQYVKNIATFDKKDLQELSFIGYIKDVDLNCSLHGNDYSDRCDECYITNNGYNKS